MNIKKFLSSLFLAIVLFLLATGIYQTTNPVVPELHPALTKNIILKEFTKEANINFLHHNKPLYNETITQRISGISTFYEAMSASVSVVDINLDGWPDFFAPSNEWGSKSHLYINNKDGTFNESAEKYGLSDLLFPVRAGFFDCDNDGVKEMLLTTYNCPVLYKKNVHGIYKKYFQFFEPCTLTTAFNIYDYDQDTLLDIVMAPFSRNVPNNWHSSDNGPGNVVLFKNTGACNFKKMTEHLNESEKRFTHAIGVGNFRGKNTQDLWAATDFNSDRVFFQDSINNEKKYIRQENDVISSSKAHNGMSVQSAYLYNNQVPSIYISQVFEPGYTVTGNQLWTYNDKDNEFKDSAKKLNINNCGWSWGSNFSDINNDGNLDLLIANGFISGDPSKNYWKKLSRFALGSRKYLGVPWHWSSFTDVTWSGHQQDCVFLGVENGFINIASDLKFDKEHFDGRGLANIDASNDGKVSFLVANQKQQLRYYKNESSTGNHWIGFNLIGTQSNRDAIGSNVWITLASGKTTRKAYYPFNGYSAQNDHRLHFGIGKNKVVSVKIVWPNGKEEVYDSTSFKENIYNTLIEGKQK